MKEIRIESRLKNNILYQKVYKYGNAKIFCKKFGLSSALIYGYIGLYLSPYLTSGNLSIAASKLSNLFELNASVLFPKWLYELKQIKVVHEYAAKELPFSPAMLPMQESPETEAYRNILKTELLKTIEALPGNRESQVIKMHFYEDYSLEEIANFFDITKTRVRQIESKAIRRLRHPKRSRKIQQLGELAEML